MIPRTPEGEVDWLIVEGYLLGALMLLLLTAIIAKAFGLWA